MSVALLHAATGVQEADIGVAQVLEMVGRRYAGDGDPARQAKDNSAQIDQSADQQGDPQRVPPGPANSGVTS